MINTTLYPRSYVYISALYFVLYHYILDCFKNRNHFDFCSAGQNL